MALAVLAADESQTREALASALAAVREPWEAASTAKNLKLIREGRERRQAALPWALPLEEELARRARRPDGG